jgi:hypothetical protein
MARLLMEKYGLDIIEWNAIDLKQTKVLEDTLSKALYKNNIQVLVHERKVVSGVILEECDCLQNAGKETLSKITDHMKNMQHQTPLICTSNELDVDPIKNAKTIFVPQVPDYFLIDLSLEICHKVGWNLDVSVLQYLKEKEDNDIRNWIMRMESLYTFYRSKKVQDQITTAMIDAFLETSQRKERDQTIYQITEKVFDRKTDWSFVSNLYNDSIILPMMVYTNVDFANCSNVEFLQAKHYISEMYVAHEIIRESNKKQGMDDLQTYSNCLSLGSVHRLCHSAKESKFVRSSATITFPSSIYNKKYTECTHRKHLNNVMSEFNVSRRDLDYWSYMLYTIYLNSTDANVTHSLILFYKTVFPEKTNSDKLKDIFKCDFLRQEIKKRRKEAILKTLVSLLSLSVEHTLDRKKRGRPKKIAKV